MSNDESPAPSLVRLAELLESLNPWVPAPEVLVTEWDRTLPAAIVEANQYGRRDDARTLLAEAEGAWQDVRRATSTGVIARVRDGGPNFNEASHRLMAAVRALRLLEEELRLLDPTGADEEPDYRPASWFTTETSVPASRLRQAASHRRKSKRVRARVERDVKLYSAADARKWWSQDMAIARSKSRSGVNKRA